MRDGWDPDDIAHLVCRIGVALLVVIFLLGYAIGARSQDCQEGAYGCRHQENHDKYKDWKNENTGGSCCNGQDCRPVKATKDEEGNWRIFIPELKDVTISDAIRKGWLYVPPSQVQKPDLWHDGRAHACTSPVYPPGSPAIAGFGYQPIPNVYCFTPSEPKI